MILTNLKDNDGNMLTEEALKQYPKVSYSELTSLQRCKRQWHWRYMVGYETASTPAYFSKGRYLHEIVAEMLRGRTDYGDVHNEVTTQMVEDGEAIFDVPAEDLSRLNEQAQETSASIINDSRDIPYVEVEFYVDLGFTSGDGTPILLHGIVDAVTVTEEGKLWLVEHKTAGRAWSDDQFNFSTQDILYAIAMESILGEVVHGSTYIFYLTRQNNPIDYRNKFITPAMKAAVHAQVGQLIRMRQTLDAFPMETLFGCGGCEFQAVCRAELAGSDVSYMLETQFTVNPDRQGRPFHTMRGDSNAD